MKGKEFRYMAWCMVVVLGCLIMMQLMPQFNWGVISGVAMGFILATVVTTE